MLVHPGRHWIGPWEPRRLVVQHMDARDLRYEDGTFDAVFSSSSLEHFGTDEEISHALDEMHRVLKPGGICSLSTEFRADGPGPGLPNVRMFDADELQRIVIHGRDWEPLAPFVPDISAATWEAAVPFSEAAQDVVSHVKRFGEVVFHRLDFSTYPHILLREGERAWTSAHVALRKPAEPRG
jgi:ubiquinone/menaquinone biosynthesis C-methylase UbiE